MSEKTDGKLLLSLLYLANEGIKDAELPQLTRSAWNDLALKAFRHGIAPLIYYRLKKSGAHLYLPDSSIAILHSFYSSYAKRNVLLQHELSNLLKAFQLNDVPVILLKGAALAETVYGNISLRSMCDLDVLVRKDDLSKSESILLDIGYNAPVRYAKKRRLHLEKLNHYHLPVFTRGSGDKETNVEIHWDIECQSDLFNIDINGIWERSRPARIAGVETLILSPEDLLIHLCMHVSFHHRFAVGLKHICDIYESIQHYREEIDWEKLISIANHCGTPRFVYITLLMTKKMLGAEIPDDVLEEIKPEDFDPGLVKLAEERILSEAFVPISMSETFASKGIPARIGSIFRFLFPPRSLVASQFNISEESRLIYLLYLLYPADFVRRRWSFLYRLALRDREILARLELDKWLRQVQM